MQRFLLNAKNNEIIESDDIEKTNPEDLVYIGIHNDEPQRMVGVGHNDLKEIFNNGSEPNTYVRCDSERQNYLFPIGLNELGDYAKHNLNSECFTVYDSCMGCSIDGAELINQPKPPLDVLTLHLRLDPVAHGAIIPMPQTDDFILVQNGILYVDDRGKKKRMTAGHAFVCETGKTASGDDAVSVMVKAFGGEMSKITLKTADLNGKPFLKRLANLGVTVDNPRLLFSLLNQQRMILVEFNQRHQLETNLELSFVGLEQNGWNKIGDIRVYKDGDRILTPEQLSQPVRSMNSTPSVMRVKGSLEEWQTHIFNPIKDNLTITSGIFLTLSPMIMEFLLNVRSTIVHYSGVSGCGKTSMMQIFASCYANGSQNFSNLNPDPVYIRKHSSTENGLEPLFELHSHSCLILDEATRANIKNFDKLAYELSNGSGKNRMNEKREAEALKIWHLLVMSTGEVDIHYLMSQLSGTKAGEFNRIFEIYLDRNVFGAEIVNGEPVEQEWVKELLLNTGKYYGSVAQAFLDTLVSLPDAEKTVQDYFKAASQRIKHPLKFAEAAIMNNVFAAEAAARIAMEAGILPITETQLEAAIDDLADKAVKSIQQAPLLMLDYVRKAFAQKKVGWSLRNNGAYEVYVTDNAKRRYGDDASSKVLLLNKYSFDAAFGKDKLTILRRELHERGFLVKTNGEHFETVESGKDYYVFIYDKKLKNMLKDEAFWTEFEAIAFAEADPYKTIKTTNIIVEDDEAA